MDHSWYYENELAISAKRGLTMLCVQRWQQVTQQEVEQVIARVRGRSLRSLVLGTVRSERWLTEKTSQRADETLPVNVGAEKREQCAGACTCQREATKTRGGVAWSLRSLHVSYSLSLFV